MTQNEICSQFDLSSISHSSNFSLDQRSNLMRKILEKLCVQTNEQPSTSSEIVKLQIAQSSSNSEIGTPTVTSVFRIDSNHFSYDERNDLMDAYIYQRTQQKQRRNSSEEEEERMKSMLSVPVFYASGKPGRINRKLKRRPSNLLLRFVIAKRTRISQYHVNEIQNIVKKTFRTFAEENV
jgi:hypothetical protein